MIEIVAEGWSLSGRVYGQLIVAQVTYKRLSPSITLSSNQTPTRKKGIHWSHWQLTEETKTVDKAKLGH